MARYHVKADGSMGVCKAKEGNCPFSGDEGTKHFTSESEARAYSEKIASRQGGSRRGMLKGGGSKPPVPPTKGSAAAASGDDWPKYSGDFGKWNGVPAEDHWRDVPGFNNDPADPSTKIRAYTMDKMVQSGFGEGVKGNEFTYDGVGYIGQSSDTTDDYVGNDGIDGKVFKPDSFGSITNPGEDSRDIDHFNKSYHGMRLSNDGKTLTVQDGWNYDWPEDDDYSGSDGKIAKSIEGRRLFRETMDAHGIKRNGDDFTVDATDPKAIDNYFTAYEDFKTKLGEDTWRQGYYLENDEKDF